MKRKSYDVVIFERDRHGNVTLYPRAEKAYQKEVFNNKRVKKVTVKVRIK